jgi:hypothetical protein
VHLHLVADDVLSGFKLRWDSERVDALGSGQEICGRPLAVARLATLCNLEPYSTADETNET